MFGNAETLRKQIDSALITPADATVAFNALESQSMFSFPLHWARLSLRDRYAADADRVIADYRVPSESSPVTTRDWQRAQAALNSAMALTPDDKSLRGKRALIDGFLKIRSDPKTARADFEEARKLLPHSPDPHLGLALLAFHVPDLDQAQNELSQASRNNFELGRREKKQLADGYRQRGEAWLASARRAHDIRATQDSLRRAMTDLAKAQDLYNAIAPFQSEAADRVSTERDRAARILAQAEQAQAFATPTP
jgi:hypothetical protein